MEAVGAKGRPSNIVIKGHFTTGAFCFSCYCATERPDLGIRQVDARKKCLNPRRLFYELQVVGVAFNLGDVLLESVDLTGVGVRVAWRGGGQREEQRKETRWSGTNK